MEPIVDFYALPTQGRPERVHLYKWIAAEENYVADKFDDQRNGHDETLKEYDIEQFWVRQVVQYYDRASAFLKAAKEAREHNDDVGGRHLEQRAQQAIAKAMMTAKGMAESSIRVYGPMPRPGMPSGYVEEWT